MRNKYLKFVLTNHKKCVIIPLSLFVRLVSYKNDNGGICCVRFIFNDTDGREYKIEIKENCVHILKSFEDFLVNDYVVFNCVCDYV